VNFRYPDYEHYGFIENSLDISDPILYFDDSKFWNSKIRHFAIYIVKVVRVR